MNPAAHIFITYLILDLFMPEAAKYLVPIALFSIILDIDHIPGNIRMLFMSKEKIFSMKAEERVRLFRTILQEPIGIITIETTLGLLYLFGIKSTLLPIAAASLFLHWLIDFMTVHTRPFMPFSSRVVSLFFHTMKQRVISEIVITFISGILFVLVYF